MKKWRDVCDEYGSDEQKSQIKSFANAAWVGFDWIKTSSVKGENLTEWLIAQQFAGPFALSMSGNWREDFVYEPGKIVPDVVRVIIPGSVETIPTDSFRMHRVLQEVVVKEGVIEVGENAFICCESLK